MDLVGRASAEEDASRLLAQRLESIAALTAGVVHDLMNTLTSVSMAFDLFGQSAPASERALLGALDEDVRRGRDALRQMLWLAAAREGEPLIYQPLHLIKEVQKLMGRQLPPIEVITDYPREACLLDGEPLLLRQLLIGLCLHARSRLPRGGSLTLRAGSALLDERTYLRIDVESRAAHPFPSGNGAWSEWEYPPALLHVLERQGGFFEALRVDAQTRALRVYLPAAQDVSS